MNVAHRDIKLGNILLNTKYRIPILKICDFGYSKVGSFPQASTTPMAWQMHFLGGIEIHPQTAPATAGVCVDCPPRSGSQ